MTRHVVVAMTMLLSCVLAAADLHLVHGEVHPAKDSLTHEALRLKVQGKQLLDPTGSVWQGHGINWGRRALGLYNSSDATIMRAVLPNVNHVRLVLDWYSWNESGYTDMYSDNATTGYLKQEWLEYIDNAVKWVTDAGMWITITTRDNVGTASPHGKVKPPDPCAVDFIGDAALRGKWLSMWRFLARRYLSTDRIAWFEPTSEPHFAENGCHNRSEVIEVFEDVVKAVHEVDPRVPVAVSTSYSACPGLQDADKLLDSQVIYVVNWFEPMGVCTQLPGSLTYGDSLSCKKAFGKTRSPCVPGCEDVNQNVTVNKATLQNLFAPALQFQTRHEVPIWVDQLGCSALQGNVWQWMLDSNEVIAQANAHWSWWTWKGGDMGVLQQPENASKFDLSSYQVDKTIYNVVKYLSKHDDEAIIL